MKARKMHAGRGSSTVNFAQFAPYVGECGTDYGIPCRKWLVHAKGVSGHIPNAYSLLEQHTWQRLNGAWG